MEAVDILKVFVVPALRNKVSPILCINQFQWLLATSHHWIVRIILTLYQSLICGEQSFVPGTKHCYFREQINNFSVFLENFSPLSMENKVVFSFYILLQMLVYFHSVASARISLVSGTWTEIKKLSRFSFVIRTHDNVQIKNPKEQNLEVRGL